jgi:cysteine desulfurase
MKNQRRQLKNRVFLDYASITPVDPSVAKEVARVEKHFWANPASLHQFGEEAKEVLEGARFKIAQILHCRANEVFFTSGGTEALNLAILGVVCAAKQEVSFPGLPHIITSTIEHPAVLEPIKFLLKEKMVEVSLLAPNEYGLINPESIKKELRSNTVLVAIQHANNEIGVMQPVLKIANVIRNFRESISKKSTTDIPYPYFLVDASQSTLFEDVSIERLKADLLVIDGIKVYGPRGVGILVAKHRTNLTPIVFGGGQEQGLRSGTQNVAAICGLAKALEIVVANRIKESERLSKLRDYAIKKIISEIPGCSLNGDIEHHQFHT